MRRVVDTDRRAERRLTPSLTDTENASILARAQSHGTTKLKSLRALDVGSVLISTAGTGLHPTINGGVTDGRGRTEHIVKQKSPIVFYYGDSQNSFLAAPITSAKFD
jgi:hypothetical protein